MMVTRWADYVLRVSKDGDIYTGTAYKRLSFAFKALARAANDPAVIWARLDNEEEQKTIATYRRAK